MSNFETVGICTFFEAPSIGCRKTIVDVTKVTYNMYTCYTCCMSREMMEMDGRDSAKRKKSRRRDIDGIFGIVLMILGQDSNSAVSYNSKEQKKT